MGFTEPVIGEKLIRDRLEEQVLAGGLRKETDPARLAELLDARLDQELTNILAGGAEAADYANLIEVLLARAAREGLPRDQIEAKRLALLEERVGFDSGLVWAPPEPVFSVAHEIPGRLRFVGAILKGRPLASEALVAQVASLMGVISAAANPITGSLIVHHDGTAATRKRIIRALEEFSGSPVSGEVAHPILRSAGRASLAAEIVTVLEEGVEKAAEEAAEEAIEAAATAIL